MNIRICLFFSLLGIIVLWKKMPAQDDHASHQILWQITGNGLSQSSYLYGTMHVKDPRAFNFSDSVLAKLYSCEIFAMEVHPDTAIASIFRQLGKERAPLIKDVMEEDEFNQLNERFKAETGMSLEKVRTNRILQMERLLRKDQAKADERPVVVDAHLFALAKSWGKELKGLENPDKLVGLLDQSSVEDLQELLDNQFIREFQRGSLDYLIDIYSKGDLNAIEAFVGMQSAKDPAFMDQLLTTRNIMMADNMESLMMSGSTFTAVGVAHLPGDDGIISLLKERGYQLEPVRATFTGLAAMYEMKPGRTVQWQTFEENTDASWSIDFPGTPISTEIQPGNNIHIMQEVGTGLAYAILVLEASERARIQSLDELYQGLVQSWKDNGRFGTDLKEDTLFHVLKGGSEGIEARLGSSQPEPLNLRIQLYKRNDYIYMPFIAAPGSYKSDSLPDHFFNSLKFKPLPKQHWSPYISLKGAFEVLMADGVEEETEISSEDIWSKNTEISATHTESGGVFSAGYVFYGEDNFFITDSLPLQRIKANALAKFEYLDLVSDSTFYLQQYPVLELFFSHPEKTLNIRLRYILRGGRTYFLVCAYEDDDSLVEDFFNSFRLLPYMHADWAEFGDDSGSYSIWFPDYTLSQGEVDFQEDYYLKTQMLLPDPEQASSYQLIMFDSLTSMSYYLYETVLSDFCELEHADSLYYGVIKDYQQILQDEDVYDWADPPEILLDSTIEINGYYGKEVWMKSRFSHLTFRSRMVLKGKYLYHLFSFLSKDLLDDPKVDRFFEGFSLGDVAAEGDPFSSKKMMILEGLASTDSIRQLYAKSTFAKYSFLETDSALLLSLLNQKFGDEGHLQNTVHELVYQKLAKLDVKSWISDFGDYFVGLDSFPQLQVNLLGFLLDQASPGVIQVLKECMKHHVAVYGKFWDDGIFIKLEKDTKMTRALFPDMIELLDYEEARKGVLNYIFDVDKSAYIQAKNYPAYTHKLIEIASKQLDTLTYEGADQFESLYGVRIMIRALAGAESKDAVVDLLNRYLDLGVEDLYMEICMALLKHNQEVKTQYLNQLAEEPIDRFQLFNNLKEIDQLSLFPKKYRKQKLMAEARICRKLGYYTAGRGRLRFIESRNINDKGKKGRVFLYHAEWNEPGDENYRSFLVVSGIYPIDKKILEPTLSGEILYDREPYDPDKRDEQYEHLLRLRE